VGFLDLRRSRIIVDLEILASEGLLTVKVFGFEDRKNSGRRNIQNPESRILGSLENP
jgi:hypothetical protein